MCRISHMHDRKLNGCCQRLLFARQLTQRKCSLCSQSIFKADILCRESLPLRQILLFYAYEKNFHLGRLCYCKHPWSNDVRQMHTADCRLVLKCLNRFPIPKLDFYKIYSLGIGNLLKHFTAMLTSLTWQSAVCICRTPLVKSVFPLWCNKMLEMNPHNYSHI